MAREHVSLGEAQAQAAEMESQARRFLKRINACRPLAPGAAIADIGSGPGLFLRAFARAGFRAVGVEPAPVARATTPALAEAERLPLEVVDGVAEKTNLPDQTFDLAFCNNVIEHVDDPADASRRRFAF